MKIVVFGLWHLGAVTAACCARHYDVVGLDADTANVARLNGGQAPLFEPGLDELIQAGLASRRLTFSNEARSACADADLLWVTHDTPVDDDDRADVESVLRQVRECVPHLRPGTLVLISSQLPVDTCRRLEDEFVSRGHRFACSPENLRLGKAIEIFSHPDRVIVGCRDARDQKLLADVFRPFTDNIIWMRPESAEMTKHALNSFLALSITFMNEVARLCEVTGADAKEVERGLKSESRIGPKAYLSPGGAFAGGTLARDVVALASLGDRHQKALELLPAIKRSNDQHRQWALQKVRQTLPNPAQATVTLLGLTYKPGTNTLRRSSAVELARALHAAGFKVRACDPSRPVLPAELSFIEIFPTPAEAVPGAQAAVVCTEWPEFRQVDWSALLMQSRLPLLVDASRFLEKNVAGLPGLQYIAVGSPA